MGWISAGAGTLLAAYALYSFTSRYAVRKSIDEAEAAKVPGAHFTAGNESKDHRAEQIALRAAMRGGESVVSPPRSPTISPPSFQVSSPSTTSHKDLRTVPTPAVSDDPQLSSTPPKPPKPLPILRSSSPPRLKPPTFGSMTPPPRPGNASVRPPPSAAASLRVPQTKVLSNTHMAPATSTLGMAKKSRKQVTLKPGYSPLDWAALAKNPSSRLRGKDAPDSLVRVTPSQLKRQNGRKGKDAWTVYQGKVYNITPYLPFHPGGEAEIMKGAGRDSVKLFMEVHPWVNWDGMLGECLVGILVSEEEELARATQTAAGLDEMD